MKKYMFVERHKENCIGLVYERFNSKGRMLPEGLYYLHSWTNNENNICFQLMETNDDSLIEKWTAKWQDLTDFEIYLID